MRYTTRLTCAYIVCLLMHSSTVHSAILEDVIYKHDGSVLRGTLTEQDFASGLYTLKLSNGRSINVEQADIEKIRKEAPLNKPHQAAQATQKIKGSVYIGGMRHMLTSTTILGESTSSYNGLNLGAQINANQHFAVYADVNFGVFTEKKETDPMGDTTTLSGSQLKDEHYASAQIAIILSTNLYAGWQFFTGLGGFSARYLSENDSDSRSASGSDIQLGMGYSWQNMQLILRVHALNSAAYSDAVDNSITTQLQLGFNF